MPILGGIPVRQRLTAVGERIVLRAAMWRYPPTTIGGVTYLDLGSSDQERLVLIPGTVARALDLIQQTPGEFAEVIAEGLKVVVSVDRLRRSRLLLGVRGYISPFEGPERGNEMLLALNLLWCATYCRGYCAAAGARVDVDWSDLERQSSSLQAAFVRHRPDAGDWLEYLQRTGR